MHPIFMMENAVQVIKVSILGDAIISPLIVRFGVSATIQPDLDKWFGEDVYVTSEWWFHRALIIFLKTVRD